MRFKIRTVERKTCTSVVIDYVDPNGKRHRYTVGTAGDDAALEAIKRRAEYEARQIEYVHSDANRYIHYSDYLEGRQVWLVERACMLLLNEREFRNHAIIKGFEGKYKVPYDHKVIRPFMDAIKEFNLSNGERGLKSTKTEDGFEVLKEDFVKSAVSFGFEDLLPEYVTIFFGFEDPSLDFVEDCEEVIGAEPKAPSKPPTSASDQKSKSDKVFRRVDLAKYLFSLKKSPSLAAAKTKVTRICKLKKCPFEINGSGINRGQAIEWVLGLPPYDSRENSGFDPLEIR